MLPAGRLKMQEQLLWMSFTPSEVTETACTQVYTTISNSMLQNPFGIYG